MRNLDFKTFILGICFLSSLNAGAQSVSIDPAIGYLVLDAIYFTDKYISPAADAAVYQASSSWVNTPQKSDLGDFTIGIHLNTFIVPNADRSFRIDNTKLNFFQIDGQDSALIPTALGSDEFVVLKGVLDGSDVVLESPEGIDREIVMYSYVQGSLGVGYGTEVIAKFAPKITLKNIEYQVYGVGLKHSVSQYFNKIEAKNVFFSVLLAYAKEDLTVNFLDVETQYGNLGFNSLNGLVDTWQLQISGSKKWDKFEFSSGLILNTSSFEYKVKGEKGQIEEIVPLRSVLTGQLRSIAKDTFNCIGEISGRIDFNHFFIQSTLAFGKFVNSNISLQYKF